MDCEYTIVTAESICKRWNLKRDGGGGGEPLFLRPRYPTAGVQIKLNGPGR